MRNTRAVVGVGTDAAVVQAMVTKQLAVRDCLPKAANGANKAPSDPAAAQILKDMAQGISKEYARLYRVGKCNATDGVPEEIATAPLELLIAAIRECYRQQARVRADRPLLALVTRETKAHAALPLDELKLANSPTSLAAIDEALADCERYEPALHALEDTLRAQRIELTRTPAATGARAGERHLAIYR